MKFDLCDASKYGELDALMCLVDEGKLKPVFEQSVRPGGSRDGVGRFRRRLSEETASIQAFRRFSFQKTLSMFISILWHTGLGFLEAEGCMEILIPALPDVHLGA